MRAGLEMAGAGGLEGQAAIRASNLSELQLTLGEVAAAVASGEAAINHADRDAFQRMSNRTTLADARHQAGEVAAAQALFEEARGCRRNASPAMPISIRSRAIAIATCCSPSARPRRCASGLPTR